MALRKLPDTFRKIVVQKLGTNFKDVTEIVSQPLPVLQNNELLIKNRFVGINASDINFTAGRYDATKRPPFDAGFEGLGEVAAVGPSSKFKPGQFVVYSEYGAFADYIVVKEKFAVPIPKCDPRFLTILVSGLTASISLEKHANLKPGETVLVTAAAGGTGQYAVQLAKMAGCHVIGTCSSQKKVDFLKSIGCDRAVNYREEDLNTVLSKEYKKGVDVVYECVGGDIFKACMKNLAKFGRMIIIGQITTYQDGSSADNFSAAASSMMLLTKSASMHAFLLFHYFPDAKRHTMMLAQQMMEGKIKVGVDRGEGVAGGPFVGLERVTDAIDYMYQRGNTGKVVVELQPDVKSHL